MDVFVVHSYKLMIDKNHAHQKIKQFNAASTNTKTTS
jgi:hypothetical protein